MLCLLSDLTVYVKHDNLVVLFVNILTSKSLKINWQIYLSFFRNCFLFLQYFLLLGVLYKAFDRTNLFFRRRDTPLSQNKMNAKTSCICPQSMV